MITLPDHAKSLELIGKTNAKAFYEGEIADALVKQSQRDGGFFCKEDLAEFDAKWVDPISVHYHGYDVWEIPPNDQGIVALMALNILKEFEFCHKEDTLSFHRQFEAIKMAFADGMKYVTDPKEMVVDYQDLIEKDRGAARAKEISDKAKDHNLKNYQKAVRYIYVLLMVMAIWFLISKAIIWALAAAS